MISVSGPVPRRVVVALAIGLSLYAVFLAVAGSHSAGGSDSAGYLGSARMLLHGQAGVPVRVPGEIGQDRRTTSIFIPLGFAHGRVPGTMSPSYPAGFPFHMAALGFLFTEKIGPFLVTPLASAMALGLLFLLGLELGLSWGWSLAGVLLLGLCPTWLLLALQPMSDVLATTWALATVLFALRARRSWRWAAATGLAFGIAVIVRPSNALLILTLAAVLPWSPRPIVAFGLGGLPVLAVLLTYNWLSYGSPILSGYGPASQADVMFRLEYFPVRFRHYAYWTAVALGPWVPLAWLGSLALRSIPWRNRLVLVLWFLPPFLFHCFYMPYEPWWFTRFFLPAFPALVVGAMLFARRMAEWIGARVSVKALRSIGAGAALLAVGWLTIGSARLRVLDIGYLESIYPETVEWARRVVPEKSVILASQMSGAVYLYSELPVANAAKLNPRTFQRIRERTEANGYTWYALLFPTETRALERDLRGRWRPVGKLRNVSLWKLEPAPASR